MFFITYKICKSKYIALLGFFATTYIGLYALFLWPSQKYYQVFPIRMIFPSLACLLVLYYPKISKKSYSWLATTLSVSAVFWNPETGIVVTLALLLHLGYTSRNKAHAARRASLFTAQFLLLLLLMVKIVEKASGGHFSFSMMFRSMYLYYSGAPIVSLKIWSIVLFVYASAFVIGIRGLSSEKSKNDDTLPIIFFVSILGMGLLVYHLNNMNEASLGCVIWPASIILAKFCDEWSFDRHDETPVKFLSGKKISKVRNKKISKVRKVLRPSVNLDVFGFSLFLLTYFALCSILIQFSQTVKDEVRIWDLGNKNSTKNLYNDLDSQGNPYFVTVRDQIQGKVSTPQARINFANTLAKPYVQTDLLILSQWDSIMYLHANARCPVSWPNWYIAFSNDEFDEVNALLKSGKIKKVVIDEIPGAMAPPYKIHAPGIEQRIMDLVHAGFVLSKRVELPKVYDSYVKGNWAQSYISVYVLK